MDKLTIQLEPSLQEQMSKHDIDWSQVCYEAIKTKLKSLNNQGDEDNINQLIDIDLELDSSDLGNFEIPEFPRKVYQAIKRVWDNFYPNHERDRQKAPTSQQVKKLWQLWYSPTWYSPFFDEEGWYSNWEIYRREELEKLIPNNHNCCYYEQSMFLLYFDDENMG